MYRYGDAEYGSRFARPDTAWDSNPAFVTFDIGPRNSQSQARPPVLLGCKERFEDGGFGRRGDRRNR
jgi:hypothetical protein